MKEYIPNPIDTNDVELPQELLNLAKEIAENTHEVWAKARCQEGWTYGAVRDDEKKEHPDMLPYDRLPESEKEYDRLMALDTIKLVKKLGWELKKTDKKETPAKVTEGEKPEKPAQKERTFRCNDCGNTVYRHEIFCSKCGKLLDHYDFED